ncbi:DUF1931 family protein [Streptomyces sp. NPDC094472]|uniref:DUF1931 family protein n=1 Tax=unclassified Streptomyces TaxID=2593676 RepID=UPI00333142C5
MAGTPSNRGPPGEHPPVPAVDEEAEPKPIPERLAAHPPLDRTPTQETEERYPEIIGGLSVALAETFKIMYPDVTNPETSHWEGVAAVFDRLLSQSRPGACRRTELACRTGVGRWRQGACTEARVAPQVLGDSRSPFQRGWSPGPGKSHSIAFT